jgi:hypothetical protein
MRKLKHQARELARRMPELVGRMRELAHQAREPAR